MPARRSPPRASCSATRSPRGRLSMVSPTPNGRRRLERLAAGGLHAYVADGTEIWLDGGHNAAGGQVISTRAWPSSTSACRARCISSTGMMETKDAHAFIAPFKGLVERIYTVPIPDEPNAFSAEAWPRSLGPKVSTWWRPTACRTRSRRSQAALQGPGARADLRLALSRRPRAQAARLNDPENCRFREARVCDKAASWRWTLFALAHGRRVVRRRRNAGPTPTEDRRVQR